MKRVLITGTAGYIATSLLAYLRLYREEYETEALSLRGEAWRAEDLSRFDAVVHCAGLAHVKETAGNARLYDEVNRGLTLALAEKAKASDVGQFIYLSSLSVYGMDEGVITPQTEPKPKSAYGRSKLEAERGLRSMETGSFRVALLRLPMVYGPGCRGNYGTLVTLAGILPAVPSYTNRRSAISIARLCGYIRKTIDGGARGVFVPQDEQYLCTCAEIARLAAESGRSLPATRLLNFGPELLRRYTRRGRKAFGDLIFEE